MSYRRSSCNCAQDERRSLLVPWLWQQGSIARWRRSQRPLQGPRSKRRFSFGFGVWWAKRICGSACLIRLNGCWRWAGSFHGRPLFRRVRRCGSGQQHSKTPRHPTHARGPKEEALPTSRASSYAISGTITRSRSFPSSPSCPSQRAGCRCRFPGRACPPPLAIPRWIRAPRVSLKHR